MPFCNLYPLDGRFVNAIVFCRKSEFCEYITSLHIKHSIYVRQFEFFVFTMKKIASIFCNVSFAVQYIKDLKRFFIAYDTCILALIAQGTYPYCFPSSVHRAPTHSDPAASINWRAWDRANANPWQSAFIKRSKGWSPWLPQSNRQLEMGPWCRQSLHLILPLWERWMSDLSLAQTQL